MNERNLKLAEQAGFYVADGKIYIPTTSEDITVLQQKFAQLIVRECGRYLNSPEFIGRSDLDWSMVLNEHFGVK